MTQWFKYFSSSKYNLWGDLCTFQDASVMACRFSQRISQIQLSVSRQKVSEHSKHLELLMLLTESNLILSTNFKQIFPKHPCSELNTFANSNYSLLRFLAPLPLHSCVMTRMVHFYISVAKRQAVYHFD